ncbi:hypothetical protein ABEB36_003721 [Hypothenemus hampei]|uniref:non-specific serine/threonine protein kinase n=1 Tax=Hypothenemus hampei TaxID=57062 RepID=A0ABD1F3K0_HYPHA
MSHLLKHAILSPKYVSPLSSGRKILGTPGKAQLLKPPYVKKLEFSTNDSDNLCSLATSTHGIPIPKIKVDGVNDTTKKKSRRLQNVFNAIEINTPNKIDLVNSGLEKFKNFTTILGKGSFGTVFKGKHRGQTVAVKIVTQVCVSKEKNAVGLNHKNIVQTLDIIENPIHKKYSLIIMELIPNCENLQEFLENLKPYEMPSGRLREIAIEITNGLQYLHNNNLIHLDLKPKNILISEDACKICDFGNSVKIGVPLDNLGYNGTAIYTAPEILLGQTPTIKSDIYSLGLVFWQMKYLKNPFDNYGPVESIIYNVVKYGLRPMFNAENDKLSLIYTECWDSDPDRRPSTTEVLRKLNELSF